MKDIKILTRYIGGALALYFAWFLVYDSYLQPTGQPDLWLTNQTAAMAAAGLDLLGYPTEVQNTSYISYLHINGNNIVGVGHACNALVLFAIFAGFILIFPGKVINKLWYIVLGIVLVFLANVLRVMSLGWIYVHWPATLDFNHKYTFTFLVYGFIFSLWMLWVKHFSTVKKQHAPSDIQEKPHQAA
jgi:exosortase family protein XrtF